VASGSATLDLGMAKDGVAPRGAEFEDDVASQLLAYMDMTSDLVGVVDDHSRLVYLNEAARKRLGVGDPTGLTTADLFPPHVFARYYDEIRPALVHDGRWSGELPVLSASDEPVPMVVTIVGRTQAGGSITGLVLHGRELARPHPAPSGPHFMHDELTLLPTRSILDDRMRVALARAGREANLVAVVLIDVDSLKDVNDTYGHAAGDEVLRVLARRMSRIVRDADTVARVGGDEFVVLLDGLIDAEAAIALSNRLREAVCRTALDIDGMELSVGASFGVALGERGDEPAELLRRADTAMYRAKARGGDNVVVFDDETEVSVTTITDEFAVAVSHGLIRPHVQPIIDLHTHEVVGYQGVARWDHPDRGLLAADMFIDIVANTPMAPVVDLAVLRRTAAVAARVARRGSQARAYGHLSRRLVGDPRLDQYLAEISGELAISMTDLCIEIAHPIVARGSVAVKSALRAVREAGARTVLTGLHGECDVSEIVEHAFDELRLARRLIHAAARDPEQHRIVTATVALAHALDLPVIAVGVETEAEELAMLDAGCDFAQGDYYSPVVPAGEAE
jgi:diguanylate cyclase (GGDEF)-like protein